MHKKSQAAMEFLMTYGWALLLVLIVIGSLTFFGILNPDTFLPDKADAGSGITVLDSVVNKNSVTLLVSNVQGKTIKNFQLNVTACNNHEGSLSNPITLLPEQTTKIIVSCNHDLPVSSSLKSDIKVSYSTTTSGISLPQVSSGELQSGVAGGESGFRALWVTNTTGSTGTATEGGRSVAVYDSDSVYLAGTVIGNALYHFGNGVTFEDSGMYDLFLVKYNSTGVAQWVANATGTSEDYGLDVAVDSNGNVYVTGYSGSDLDFGNGVSFENSDGGGYDVYVVKYNSAGVPQWVVNGSGSSADIGRSVAVDSNDNVYVTGEAYGDLDFGNGVSFENSVSGDFFIVKYNSAGVPQWVVNGTGSGVDTGRDIVIDNSGSIYVTGYASSSIDFGNGVSFENAGNSDMFLIKYNSAGIPQWVANATSDSNSWGYGLVLDSNNNIYVTGGSTDDIDFGNGVSFENSGGVDFFLIKYNSTGVAQWVANATGSSNDYGYDVVLDSNDNIYAAGNTRSNLDFGSGVSFENANAGFDDVFVVKYNTNGLPQWVANGTGISGDLEGGLAIDSSGNIYLGGESYSNLDLGNGVSFLNSDNSAAFVVKYEVD